MILGTVSAPNCAQVVSRTVPGARCSHFFEVRVATNVGSRVPWDPKWLWNRALGEFCSLVARMAGRKARSSKAKRKASGGKVPKSRLLSFPSVGCSHVLGLSCLWSDGPQVEHPVPRRCFDQFSNARAFDCHRSGIFRNIVVSICCTAVVLNLTDWVFNRAA